jgi:pyruvate dehydrogenase E2 component (dihydrolipoamide acetyltransferase)
VSVEQIKTPDIGGEAGEIIEILVAEGDQVEEEQSLVVLESAKASMEVPCPKAGKVAKLLVSVGDSLEEGMPILDLEPGNEPESDEPKQDAEDDAEEAKEQESETADSGSEQKSEQEPSGTSDNQPSQLIKVPDIGSDSAEVIEISVKVGDFVKSGDALVLAESEKASMDIPSDYEGRIEAIHVETGSQISEGQDLVTITISSDAKEDASDERADNSGAEAQPEKPKDEKASSSTDSSSSSDQLIKVPDLGSESAEVIELSVEPGDTVKEGDTLVVAESEKASLEVPSEVDGEIIKLHCAVGDKISQGDDLVTIKTSGRSADAGEDQAAVEEKPAEQEKGASDSESDTSKAADKEPQAQIASKSSDGNVYAGPAVRKLAREFGIDLAAVKASGPRGRALKEDLHGFVKRKLKEPAGGSGIPAIAEVDWAKFGSIHSEPTSRIHRLTAENMHRSWLNVPHVTQFDDADVTELEEYRAMIKHEGAARGIKMTPLAFILKASYKALKNHPKFNAALSADAAELIFREYFHIGVAVDTPAGLMVPVVRDVDKKDIWQLASEIAELADKAKNAKLKPTEMQGACFTVSSLGAIGGKGFTPIVPAPQVGILGVSKTSVQPVWSGEEFQPRKLMPLALSYDHRAVNGADAGKFLTYLADQLSTVESIWSD